jgi:hypothetical protein
MIALSEKDYKMLHSAHVEMRDQLQIPPFILSIFRRSFDCAMNKKDEEADPVQSMSECLADTVEAADFCHKDHGNQLVNYMKMLRPN